MTSKKEYTLEEMQKVYDDIMGRQTIPQTKEEFAICSFFNIIEEFDSRKKKHRYESEGATLL